jgi:hypothetical protein
MLSIRATNCAKEATDALQYMVKNMHGSILVISQMSILIVKPWYTARFCIVSANTDRCDQLRDDCPFVCGIDHCLYSAKPFDWYQVVTSIDAEWHRMIQIASTDT